jgi:hypothetical protein
MATGNDNLHCSNVLPAGLKRRQVTYDEPVSPRREPVRKRAPSPRQDRAVAMVIWVVTGLLFGLALGVFTNRGWLCLSLGLVVGILLAVTKTRPGQAIDED